MALPSGPPAGTRPQVTLRALLALAAVDLGFLAMEASSAIALDPLLLAGRLALAAVLLVPGAYLLAGGDPARLSRLGPGLAVLGAGAFALVAAGQEHDLALGYLGFLPAVPLLYVLVFPEEPYGALAAGLTLFAAGIFLAGRLGAAPDLTRQVLGGLALCTAVAGYGARAARRSRAREAAAVEARTEAIEAMARLEAERGRAERLAAVGALADRVAHDVNSPLASLRSNLRFAREEQAEGRTEEASAALEDAVACATRIQAIVGALRSAPPPEPGTPGPCDLEEVARLAIEETRPRLPEGVGVQVELPGGLPAVPAPRWLLGDLLVQLILTAAEGLGGGTVRLCAQPRAGAIRLQVLCSGREAQPWPRPEMALARCEAHARRAGARLEWREGSGTRELALELPIGELGAAPGAGPR